MGGITVDSGPRVRLPRLTGESPDVFPGSPLAVIGLWVFALRERFALDVGTPMPWVWEPNLRPEDAEDGNPPPDGSPRKLLIDSAYNVKKEERNYRPAIYVGRGGGPVTPNKLAIDNKAGVHFPTHLRAYWCQAQMPVVMECESSDSGESSTIAETAWAFVLSTRDIFRADFGFHEITEPSMTDTIPSKIDKEIWTTNVQFGVSYDLRWGVTPIAPKLRDIAVRLSAGYTDATAFYQDIALRDEQE